MTATRRSTESAFSSAFTKEVKKKDRPGSDWRWSMQWDVTTDFGSHIVSSPAGMFFPSRGPDFPKKIIFQKKRRKKASEYLEVKIFYLPLHSQSGNNGLHEEGSIAQLVQSVCLTSRGSGVRIPVLPQRNGLRYKSQPVSAFTTVARSRTTRHSDTASPTPCYFTPCFYNMNECSLRTSA